MVLMSLDSAIRLASRTSRESQNLVQLRKIAPDGYGVFIPSHPGFKPVGDLVATYRYGSVLT